MFVKIDGAFINMAQVQFVDKPYEGTDYEGKSLGLETRVYFQDIQEDSYNFRVIKGQACTDLLAWLNNNSSNATPDSPADNGVTGYSAHDFDITDDSPDDSNTAPFANYLVTKINLYPIGLKKDGSPKFQYVYRIGPEKVIVGYHGEHLRNAGIDVDLLQETRSWATPRDTFMWLKARPKKAGAGYEIASIEYTDLPF